MEKGNKKIINGWVFYDWANSVYNLVISSAIFPIFYDAVTKNRFKAQFFNVSLEEASTMELPKDVQVTVEFFGMKISSSVLFSFVLACSFLVVSILSPLLSGVADFSGKKKKFLRFFCYLGSAACISLFWFKNVPLELGMFFVFIASIGFWNSLVFYNAFLPEIAEVEEHDKISARGFSMGYFGAMILLILCLLWIKLLNQPAEYSFLFVGIWWLGFSQITFRVLPNNVYNKKQEKGILWKGFKELKIVFKVFKTTHRLKKYLSSFFFFNTGVQTVMLMATIFANKEINWPGGDGSAGLIIAILLIQILGALGAFLMSRLSGKIGNIKTLILSVSIWVVICCYAFIIHQPVEFYILASLVGLVMGGVQAIARSTYSKFLPQETTDHASYFSFYDVTEKLGIVLGLVFFGLMEHLTGSIRFSIISVAFFFVVGLILLLFVPKEERIN
ncbi:MAG: MFS transporter [Flavobacteriia bacterium]|nr:MFS transporter [Flavobacteriia bacterium]